MTADRKTILVAVDFDDSSRRALDTATWLASALDADLTLLHVHDRPGFDHPELPGDMVVQLQTLLEQAVTQSLTALGAKTHARKALLLHGDPAQQILHAVDTLKPAMVVMGTHGRRGLNRLLMGSIATQVVHACPVPVVTVRA